MTDGPAGSPTDPSPLTRAAWTKLGEALNGDPSPERLAAALRVLAKWRAQVIANTIVQRGGSVISHGPFRGMDYQVSASEGGYVPRRLGVYEASLGPVIEEIVTRAYPRIIDVGCAEGYYAVGLARRIPDTMVEAYDTDPKARAACARLATLNGVSDRITIGTEIGHGALQDLSDPPTVVLCDIEGAERVLIDPARAPGLLDCDLLVETHDGIAPGVLRLLTERFTATHRIQTIGRVLLPEALPDWAERLSDLDRLLMLWEWRASPTPWLWMTRRQP